MTVDIRRNTLRLTSARAWCGDRSGRNPYEFGQKSASKMGRLHDLLQCPLHHAIADTRYLQRSNFAVVLWNVDPTVRLRSYPPEGRRSLSSAKNRQPADLNSLKRLAINPRGTAVSLGNAIRLLQGVDFRHMAENPPEAVRRIRLRLLVYAPSQFL